MLAQEVFRKIIFVCERNIETEVYETFFLHQRHVFDVPSLVKCCMYHVFHHTPHSVPAGQVDCFLNVTIKVHHENKLAKARKTRKSPGTLGFKKFGPGKLRVQ